MSAPAIPGHLDLDLHCPASLLCPYRFEAAVATALHDPGVVRACEFLEIDAIDELRRVLELMREQFGKITGGRRDFDVDDKKS